MNELILEEKQKLPNGWKESNLNLLSLVVTKGSTPTTHGFKYQIMGINFIKVENIVDGWIDQNTVHEFISQDTNDYLKRSQLQENDILFSIAGTIGRTSIIRKIDLPANTNQAIAIIRCPWKYLNPKYIRLILDSPILFHIFSLKTRGVGIYNLSLNDIKELKIPIPPLNEQKRIVAKIESIFSQIDAGQTKLDAVKILLKQQKQSVLKVAFEGNLVPQDPNDEPAEVLLKKIHVDSKIEFDKENLPKGWIRTKIGFTIDPSKDRFDPITNKNKTFIGLEHIESNTGKIIRKGESKNLTSTKTIFRSGDILYGRLRPYLNKVCVPNFNGVCSTDILVLKKNSFLSNRFIALFFATNCFVTYANANMTGVQHPRISFKKISIFTIPLPPLNEQHRIVTKIESIFGRIDAIEKQVNDSLIKLDHLKKSVLKKAFEGKLVPQDPNDEPASVLLDKIKLEKSHVQKK